MLIVHLRAFVLGSPVAAFTNDPAEYIESKTASEKVLQQLEVASVQFETSWSSRDGGGCWLWQVCRQPVIRP